MQRTASRGLRQLAPSRQRALRPRPQARLSVASTRMSYATLPPVSPPVSTQLPTDAFQLLPESAKPASEDALFAAQVDEVKRWWAGDRFKGIKRPYSAEDVVDKRGTLQQTYPSSLMARKLFNLFRERAAQGEPVHTRGYCSRLRPPPRRY